MDGTSREQIIENIKRGGNLERVDLRDLILDHLSFENATLCRADLEGTDLEGCDFEGANLAFASLREAYLGHANLRGANLFKADLEEANLQGANLQFADLSHANLAGANLERADLRKARLSYAQLELANLGRANLEEALFDHADLCESYLGGARLVKAHLRHARVAKAVFEHADLTDADVRNCCLLDSLFDGAVLTGSKLYGTEAVPEQFSHVSADWVDFSAEADGAAKISGTNLADHYHRLRDGVFGFSPSAPDAIRRLLGPGDTICHAAFEFSKGSQVEIEAHLRDCTIALGEGTRLVIGPEGVLAGCQVVGEGEIVIHGKFYENGFSPGIVGPGRMFVGKTGTVISEVRQRPTLTQFAFEKGCTLNLKIRQSVET
jgi:uncharacterized protein YjbI with pentapeptide repeats